MLTINPTDAQAAGVRDGDLVEVTSRRGAVSLRARVTDSLPAGMVRLDSHWPQAPFGRLVSEAFEPTTGTPELKYTAVRVGRAPAASLAEEAAADK